ncbi:MAG: GTP-binding protein [Ferruginibacter sp.]
MENGTDSRIPVTVLTGFLGSGKTTLLNRILTENHGKKIAIIENEFGEVGVDSELVIGADEELFEMNNGCICCTVRGDLIRILGNLTKRKDKLDMIMIETTGLADPGPVAQTFFVDDEMQSQYKIDAIITLVDAKHVLQHIDDSDECKQQIAFADVIILNKIDLVTAVELQELENRIRRMNALAKIHHTKDASLDLKYVLEVNAFDLDKKAELNPEFLIEELPFEYGGIYEFDSKEYALTLDKGPDPHIDIAFIKLNSNAEADYETAKRRAIVLYSDDPQVQEHFSFAGTHKQMHRFMVSNSHNEFVLRPHETGFYAVFTQHHPNEFNMHIEEDNLLVEPLESHEYEHSHTHDDEVTSVGIDDIRPVNLKKFDSWINYTLQTQGIDIYRSKGIINVDNRPDRLVFQAVHMLLDIASDRNWNAQEQRRTQMVFIGKNLDRKELLEGFEACLS